MTCTVGGDLRPLVAYHFRGSQGETDAMKQVTADTYLSRFETFVADARLELGCPDLAIFTVAVTSTTSRLPHLTKVGRVVLVPCRKSKVKPARTSIGTLVFFSTVRAASLQYRTPHGCRGEGLFQKSESRAGSDLRTKRRNFVWVRTTDLGQRVPGSSERG